MCVFSVLSIRPTAMEGSGAREMRPSCMLHPRRGPSTEDRSRSLGNAPIGFARWESRTRTIALLPYCLIALLPYCLTALLPYCPIASPPPIGLTRPTGLAMMGGRSQPGPGSPYRGEKGKGCKSPAVPPP